MAEVILSAYCVKTEVTKPERYLENAAHNYLRSGTEPMGTQAREQSTEYASPLDETSRFAVGIGYSEGNSFHLKLTFNTLGQEKKKCGSWRMDGNHCTVPPPWLKTAVPCSTASSRTLHGTNQSSRKWRDHQVDTDMPGRYTRLPEALCSLLLFFFFFF